MMEWLTLITGAVVAVATAVLAYITWQHVRLTRETLKATYKPEIIIRLLRGNLYVHNEYFADYEIIKIFCASFKRIRPTQKSERHFDNQQMQFLRG